MRTRASGFRRKHASFTLIEMLAVVAIIGILVATVVRLSTIVAQKIARARAARQIEMVKMCLEEFYKVYGEYPPDNNYGGTEYEPKEDGGSRYPPDWEAIRGSIQDPSFNKPANTGLVYYILACDHGLSYHPWKNKESDVWKEYYEQTGGGSGERYKDDNSANWGVEYGEFSWTNRVYFIHDPWGHDLRYECKPPYQSYRIWSIGPTGDPDDDVGRDAWTE